MNQLYYIKKQIRDLTSGDIILHPIYRTDGLMLVNKYKMLSTSLISMVKKHIISTAWVLVAPSQEIFNSFVENNSSESEAFLRDSSQIASELNIGVDLQPARLAAEPASTYASTKNSDAEQNYGHSYFTELLSKYPLWVSLDHKLESELLKLRADCVKNDILKAMQTNNTFKELFNRIREYDDVLLIHSINTMCLALMIGLTLELNQNELFDLTVAALFSNVGFVEIEKNDFLDYLRTNEHITAQLKGHLEAFSEITEEYPALRKKSIVFGILDHHEFYNGKGYPNGKSGEEISLYGRILSIAHNYDELVGGYNYEIGLHPIEALRIIYENIDKKYDQNILDIFIRRTTYFKLGEVLTLPNILKGVIIGFDDFVKRPHLPIVKLESGNIINLANS